MVAKMRKMDLYIAFYDSTPCEWGIHEHGMTWKEDEYSQKANKAYGFATFCLKNGLFNGAFCISFSKKRLELVKNEAIFEEICGFECDIDNEKFTREMSFKDAFELIYKEFSKI